MLIRHVGVAAALASEAAFRAMAGDKHRVIAHGPELLLDAGNQRVVIALRKIGAAYRAGKQHIADEGLPIVQPPGGHAIYLDARAFLPHIPREQFPGVALGCELYLEGGIRSVEIGALMFGAAAQMDLVRLAIPRRVYTQSHMDYVIEVILDVWRRREQIRGLRLTYEAPFLRHFTARLEPLPAEVELPAGR